MSPVGVLVLGGACLLAGALVLLVLLCRARRSGSRMTPEERERVRRRLRDLP